MFGASQLPHPLDGEQVGGDARDAGPHAVEHAAELLEVGLARGVVDRRGALGQHSRHDDVGRTRHGGFVEQHVAPLEAFGPQGEKLLARVEVELGPQPPKAQEVGVEPAASDLVPAGLGHVTHPEAGQQRADKHDRAAQPAGAAAEIGASHVVRVDVRRAECVGVLPEPFDLHAECREQLDELHHVEDVGHVAHHDPLGREQHGAENLQRLVLGPLRGDLSVEAVSALDLKQRHGCEFCPKLAIIRQRACPLAGKSINNRFTAFAAGAASRMSEWRFSQIIRRKIFADRIFVIPLQSAKCA